MAKRAELKAKLSLDRSSFSRGISSAIGESRAFAASLGKAAFNAGIVGMAALGVASTAAAIGIAKGVKAAFDLGGALSDVSAQTGITAGKILIMQRAFADTGVGADQVGVSINRMQRFLEEVSSGTGTYVDTFKKLGLTFSDLQGLSPDKQFAAIGAAIDGIEDPTRKAAVAMEIFGRSGGKMLTLFADKGAMGMAAKSIGGQAKLLDENAAKFDEISDKLGRAGDKLQGFFVGVGSKVADSLLPVLEKMEKIDLASMGQKFGDGILRGVDALIGAFKDPAELGNFLQEGFDYGIKSAGNILIAVFTAGLAFFRDGMITTMAGLGQIIIATLLDAFQAPIAYLQAGVEKALKFGGNFMDRRKVAMEEIKKGNLTKEQGEAMMFKPLSESDQAIVRKQLEDANMDARKRAAKEAALRVSTAGNSESFEDIYNRRKSEAAEFGIGGGKTADQWRSEGSANISKGISAAARAAGGMNVNDVLGAGDAKGRMGLHFQTLANEGGESRRNLVGESRPRDTMSAEYRAQLIGMYGRDGIPENGASVGKSSAGFRTPASFGRFTAAALTPMIHGGGGLSGGAYGQVRKGDSARRKIEEEAAREKAKKEEEAKNEPLIKAIDHPAWVETA